MVDEPFGQRLDVGVGDGKGQEQFQELVILQGPGPPGEEALPQAAPVSVVVGFFGFFHHLHFFTPVFT